MHQKSGSLCKGFCKNRIRHGRAAELCQAIPKFVVARPLHLAYARPLCGLKAPLGLSLLRKRQFLHSILFFKRKLQHGLLCGLRRGIRCDWYRIACKENKNGTCSLTTCTPRFLFYIEKERFISRSPQAPDKVLRPRRRGIWPRQRHCSGCTPRRNRR